MQPRAEGQIADSLAPQDDRAIQPPGVPRVRERGTGKPIKTQDSLEALYALIFAVCVLLALFLLVG